MHAQLMDGDRSTNIIKVQPKSYNGYLCNIYTGHSLFNMPAINEQNKNPCNIIS